MKRVGRMGKQCALRRPKKDSRAKKAAAFSNIKQSNKENLNPGSPEPVKRPGKCKRIVSMAFVNWDTCQLTFG